MLDVVPDAVIVRSVSPCLSRWACGVATRWVFEHSTEANLITLYLRMLISRHCTPGAATATSCRTNTLLPWRGRHRAAPICSDVSGSVVPTTQTRPIGHIGTSRVGLRLDAVSAWVEKKLLRAPSKLATATYGLKEGVNAAPHGSFVGD